MLSSVLRSKRAVAMNISIMRAFVRLCDMLMAHKDLAAELERLKRKQGSQGRRIQQIHAFINKLLAPAAGPRRTWGFRPPKKEEE